MTSDTAGTRAYNAPSLFPPTARLIVITRLNGARRSSIISRARPTHSHSSNCEGAYKNVINDEGAIYSDLGLMDASKWQVKRSTALYIRHYSTSINDVESISVRIEQPQKKGRRENGEAPDE